MQTENPAKLLSYYSFFICNGLIKHTMIDERYAEN